jgi:hypothetical protein
MSQMYPSAAEIPCLSLYLYLSIEEKFSSGNVSHQVHVTASIANLNQRKTPCIKFAGYKKISPTSTICLTSIQHSKKKGRQEPQHATMPASRARTMLPLLLSVCAVALLLPPASADPALLDHDPAAAGDSWPADSPADAPTAVPATLGWAEDEVAGRIAAAPGPGRQAFRPRQQPSALSPEQRRGLDDESRCGPRVPVRGGAFPWPGWKPRCRGGGGAAAAPAVRHLLPLVDEP